MYELSKQFSLIMVKGPQNVYFLEQMCFGTSVPFKHEPLDTHTTAPIITASQALSDSAFLLYHWNLNLQPGFCWSYGLSERPMPGGCLSPSRSLWRV